ncbi:hypothetical protein DIURU_001843 [Diutina rugosa]|uniref:Major facilitator superfamily (MFS) profile domain-containing protein n=1 Tax=Diutina rugosa TaxID=5481 RepID=A0A642UT20_DIURU|nr:uncharacterized protein DIURU_001843 [Diutina rugosa]KAA8904767.1 hypothetical protein DIURU_001843 [Diutina rugosa]
MPYATSGSTQFEVKKLEILSNQYTHPAARVAFYFALFLVAYAYGLDGNIRYVFQATAASSYSSHSLYATVNVIRAVVAAAAQFAYARLSDTFGRLQLLVVSILFYVVGTIITSQAYDIQRFAGGSVLYQIGYTGLMIVLQLLIMDNSTLNWRMACSFIPALPFIINTWISGDITSAIGTRWSWGIGMWAFILPLACVPLLVMLVHIEWMARKTPEWQQLMDSRGKSIDDQGKAVVDENGKPIIVEKVSWLAYFVDLFHRLDVIGLLLVVCVFGFILVPFTIAGGVQEQWKTAKIIAPLVIGFCLIPVFVVWETKFAKNPLLPGHLMRDRGVWSAMIIGVFVNWVWYMPNDYMYTVLVVAVNESVTSATRITSLYSFVSVITGSIVGLFVVKFRRLKPLIIFGICVWFVANGLLVHYRSGDDAHSGIIAGLVLFGFGAGFFTYATQASIQACTSHQHMAVVTAAYLSSYNIGSAIGASISGAVWTQLLYNKLVEKMGDAALAKTAYGSPFEFIVDYPWGDPTRMQMVHAYREVQKILCVIGLCLVAPMLIVSFFLRDPKLESKQALEGIEEKNAKQGLKGVFDVFKMKKSEESHEKTMDIGVAEISADEDTGSSSEAKHESSDEQK